MYYEKNLYFIDQFYSRPNHCWNENFQGFINDNSFFNLAFYIFINRPTK